MDSQPLVLYKAYVECDRCRTEYCVVSNADRAYGFANSYDQHDLLLWAQSTNPDRSGTIVAVCARRHSVTGEPCPGEILVDLTSDDWFPTTSSSITLLGYGQPIERV